MLEWYLSALLDLLTLAIATSVAQWRYTKTLYTTVLPSKSNLLIAITAHVLILKNGD